jgi:phage-related protein
MANFPVLNSGAIAQYPMSVAYRQSVEVIRFLDGTDQRFLAQGQMFRSWSIDLMLLSEDELEQIRSFFESQAGDYSCFVFPDPISGAGVANCRIGSPELELQWEGFNATAGNLWVVETNG